MGKGVCKRQYIGADFPNNTVLFLISNFRHVLNVVCFLLGNSPASEFYMPTFRNTLFHLHMQVDMKYIQHILLTYLLMKMEQSVFRNVGMYNSDAGELPRRKHTTRSYILVLTLCIFHVASQVVVHDNQTGG